MLKYIFILSVWFGLTSDLKENQLETKGVFAIKIGNQNESFYTLMAYCKTGDRITNKRILSMQEFIQFATGNWPSVYNPERINYLQMYDLNCGFVIDTFSRKQEFGCIPLDSLWKLQYSSFPYLGSMEPGWAANEFGPSDLQAKYLCDRYNFKGLSSGLITDTNLFKLLGDVMDQVWIENYKSLR
jgi:hypothetical protein